jgi:hypothetical protein
VGHVWARASKLTPRWRCGAAQCGFSNCTSPWAVEDEDLTVISYVYRTRVDSPQPAEKVRNSPLVPPDVPQQWPAREEPQFTDRERSPQ